LVLVSGDNDYELMIVDYEKQGRKVTVCFYQPPGGGTSIDLLNVVGAEFIDFANPKQSSVDDKVLFRACFLGVPL
jgi:hypothetical protein